MQSLERLIVRVEAWSYADTDAGAGQSRELARALRSLASIAPTPALLAGVRHAQDALDDGLSAEVVPPRFTGCAPRGRPAGLRRPCRPRLDAARQTAGGRRTADGRRSVAGRRTRFPDATAAVM